MIEGWRWRDDHLKQLLAFSIMFLVNPHLKKPVSFEKIYHALIGQAEVARRKSVDHKEIIRGRRRLAAARREDGKRR